MELLDVLNVLTRLKDLPMMVNKRNCITCLELLLHLCLLEVTSFDYQEELVSYEEQEVEEWLMQSF